MDRTMRTEEELTALLGLITAAMADCDVPGAGERDREEWDRLFRYRAAVRDAQRGVHVESANPETQAMADWLNGEGPNPLTSLGHSLDWTRGDAAAEPREELGGSLTITAIGPDDMPGLLAHLLGDEPDRNVTAAPQSRPPVASTWMADPWTSPSRHLRLPRHHTG